MTSFFGLFNTSIMGMNAQADALSNISANIANANTVGYKRATTNFLTVLGDLQGSEARGGGVSARTRYDITSSGSLMSTGSETDLAIRGNGFFVVSDENGINYLTRAGSFMPDSTGRLVNAAGYILMGFEGGDSNPNGVSYSLSSLTPIQIQRDQLYARSTTEGVLSTNLPVSAAIVPAANLPSANGAGATFSGKTSLTAYDSLGQPVVLDVFYSRTATNTWEMTIYDAADSATGAFPYASAALVTQTLTFDATSGSLLTGSPANFTLPGGSAISLDISRSTQLGAPFIVNNVTLNGNAPGAVSQIQIFPDGTLNYRLENGFTASVYRVALANVDAPSRLSNVTGNALATNNESGPIFIGVPGDGGLGLIEARSLEASTVDLASELSSMIIAQRSFTANSQTFQIASEILQVINNLK